MILFIKTLRSHYREQDATSLFTTLSTDKQHLNETAQEFAMRLLTLKQKIIFVSQEDACGYSPLLVQERFLHTMLTGLRSDNIRAELRPLLKNKNTSDDELLEGLTKAVADESEHLDRFNKNPIKKPIQVASVEIPKKENPILKEINELKTQVAQINELVLGLPYRHQGLGSQPSASTSRHFEPRSHVRNTDNAGNGNRCEKCAKDGRTNCDHCFYCFSQEHFSRGCKQRMWDRKNPK